MASMGFPLPRVDDASFAQAVFDALTAHIAILNETGQIIAVNHAWREFAGDNPPLIPNAAVGMNYLTICESATGDSAVGATEFADGIRAVMHGQQGSFVLEYPCHAPWEQRWFMGRVTRLFVGGKAYVMAAHADITDRKQAAERLQESEAKFRGLIEHAPDAIIVVDEEGRITLSNVRAETIFGYTRAELLGQPAEGLIPERFRKIHIQHLINHRANPQTRLMGTGYDLAARRKDGSEFPVEISLNHVRAANGALTMAFVVDITERKQAEAQRMRLVEDLQHSNAKLQEALHAKDEMIANVSHELRTPLTQILGYSELLADGAIGQGLDEEQGNAMQVIIDKAYALTHLVDSLLNLQMLDAGGLDWDEVDVNSLLSRTAFAWGGRAEQKGVPLETRLPDASARVRGDFRVLRQLLDQLLDNALKFTLEGGQVVLAAEQHDNEIWLSVADTGIGIALEKLARVFEHFYQVDGSSTRRYGGMGIGLALAKQIVALHGGRIWVESEGEGKGTTLYVALPCVVA